MNSARGWCDEVAEHNLSHNATSQFMSKGVILHAISRPADMPKKAALAKGCFLPLLALYYRHAVEMGNTARLRGATNLFVELLY